MESITQSDIDTVKRLGGTLNTDESRLELKAIYDKLEFLCHKIKKKGYEVQLRKDPRNQGGGFKYLQKYLWAKVYPKEYHKSCKDKLAFIIGVSDSIHFHVRGIKDYEHNEPSNSASKKSWQEVPPSSYEDLVNSFVDFESDNRQLFIETAAQLKIDNFTEILENMNHTKIKNLLKHKKQIILQGPPGTGKTRLAKEIANKLVGDDYTSIKNELTNVTSIPNASGTDDYYTIQEIKQDSVVLTSNRATQNWEPKFEGIVNKLQQLYNNEIPSNVNGLHPYELAVAKYLYSINFKLKPNYQLIQFHPSYTYEDFVRGISVKNNEAGQIEYKTENRVLARIAKEACENSSKKYVLIIDEINRANLSSVLGELIYALEYRGEPVESMYEMEDEGNAIILPPNLYIIGTMNTADRSVGQIDYAIRRRFAFVDVLPKVLDNSELEKEGKKFAKTSFEKVTELFIENNDVNKPSIHLSEEFKPKDVWLGHSYFILDKEGDFSINLEYEIKPILREFIADGILKESALEIINGLSLNND